MSIHTAMTAIADKIRGLLGLAGTMGLDAIASNLAVEQANIADAFAAVSSKGGTVPDSQVSGNLAAAIETIPAGATVQTATGSFVGIGTYGEIATINCGFSPDVVFIHLPDAYTEDGHPYVNDMCANTAAVEVGGDICCVAPIGELYDDTYLFAFGYIRKTETGFIPSSFFEMAMTGDYWYTTKTYGYTAIKYT